MVATSEQYKKALIGVRNEKKLRGTSLEMLKAQYSMPNHIITASGLARAVGFENYNAANLRYGSLGREIAVQLSYTPPKRNDGTPIWFWSISYGNEASDATIDGHYEFVMRPELVRALEEMKWVS